MKSEAIPLAHKARAVRSTGQELRAVGQGLESLDVEDFDLTAEDQGYFALATRRAPKQTRKALAAKAIRITWQKLSGHDKWSVEARPDILRIVVYSGRYTATRTKGKRTSQPWFKGSS